MWGNLNSSFYYCRNNKIFSNYLPWLISWNTTISSLLYHKASFLPLQMTRQHNCSFNRFPINCVFSRICCHCLLEPVQPLSNQQNIITILTINTYIYSPNVLFNKWVSSFFENISIFWQIKRGNHAYKWWPWLLKIIVPSKLELKKSHFCRCVMPFMLDWTGHNLFVLVLRGTVILARHLLIRTINTQQSWWLTENQGWVYQQF